MRNEGESVSGVSEEAGFGCVWAVSLDGTPPERVFKPRKLMDALEGDE